MTTKVEHSNAAPETYWSILNRLLYSKKNPAIPPLFVDGSFYCFYMHTYKNKIVYYLPFYIRPLPE